MTLPNADDPRGGTPMNTDDELHDQLHDFLAIFELAKKNSHGLIKESEFEIAITQLIALLRKASLQRAIEELKKVDPIASHLLSATVSDRIEKLQAELTRLETKENV